MVINIRGCSGAGKSTLVRQLISHHGGVPILRPDGRKVEGYQVGTRVRVVGAYDRPCGGAEGMKQEEVCRLVREYAEHGSVVFEGLHICENTTRYLNLARELGEITFAFLRPPLDVCLARVHQRRAASGTTRPFQPERVRGLWGRLPLHFEIFSQAGNPCLWLHWEDALTDLEMLLRLPNHRGRHRPQVSFEAFPTLLPRRSP